MKTDNSWKEWKVQNTIKTAKYNVEVSKSNAKYFSDSEEQIQNAETVYSETKKYFNGTIKQSIFLGKPKNSFSPRCHVGEHMEPKNINKMTSINKSEDQPGLRDKHMINTKTASEYIAEARRVSEESYASDETKAFASEIESGLSSSKIPFVKVNTSSLANYDMIHIRISLDPKSEWSNNIYQNSRYAQFSLSVRDMKLELLSKDYHIQAKFRKSKVKDAKTTVDKIIKFVESI